MRYYIRPTFNHLSFKTRQDAIDHVDGIDQYCSLKYWVDRSTDGRWHIYCDKGLFVIEQNLNSFPQPYKTILKEF